MNRVVARPGRDDIGVDRTSHAQRRRQRGRVEVLEIVDVDAVAGGLIRSGREREIDGGGPARGVHDERIDARPAVEARFRPMIMDGVVASPRRDDVGSAAAVDRVVAGPSDDDVGPQGPRDRNARRERGGVDVLEIEHRGVIAEGLIGDGGEIDGRRGLHDQRVVPGPAVDAGLGAIIRDRIVSGAGVYDVGAAAAVDGVGARTGGDRIGVGGAGDRQRRRQNGGVDVLEIGHENRVAGGLVQPRGHGEVDRGHAAGSV